LRTVTTIGAGSSVPTRAICPSPSVTRTTVGGRGPASPAQPVNDADSNTAANAQRVEETRSTDEALTELGKGELLFVAAGLIRPPQGGCLGLLPRPVLHHVAREIKVQRRLANHEQ